MLAQVAYKKYSKNILLVCLGGSFFSGPVIGAPPLQVPTDPSAEYEAISSSLLADSTVVIVTKRVGRSGTSYSKRKVDCVAGTAMYLGDGSSMEEMNSSTPDKRMSKPIPESITFYISSYACAHGDMGASVPDIVEKNSINSDRFFDLSNPLVSSIVSDQTDDPNLV